MALKNILFVPFVPLLVVGVACTPQAESAGQTTTGLGFRDAPVRAELETVAVLTPLEAETEVLWKSLVLELGEDFNIVTIPVNRSTAPNDLSRELTKANPSGIVVVDNRTLHLYRELQGMLPNQAFPPAVVVMTSFLERSIGTLRSATGIAYEVPIVSGIVALREVSRSRVEKVGVVHRKNFSKFVAAQAELAEVEKVSLVPVAVGNDPTPEEVEDALDELVINRKVDALWVLNDNGVLQQEHIVSAWLPVLSFKPIPVIVGVSALVRPDVHFGTLAVYPNHARLGAQTANLVFDLADNEWQIEQSGEVELPLSVVTVVDVGQVKDHFGLKADALAKIDKAVE